MAQETQKRLNLSPRRIVGFACNQAFVFSLLYLEINRAFGLEDGLAGRIGLLTMLVSMVVGFAIVRGLGSQGQRVLFSRPALYACAIAAAAASLIPVMFSQIGVLPGLASSVPVGVPLAVLLTAWGKTFGLAPTAVSAPEVFLGSLVSALVCLVFAFAQDSFVAVVVMRLLPLASVVNIEVPDQDKKHAAISVDGRTDDVRVLSAKILAGTVLFGLVAGLMETYRAPSEVFAVPYIQLSMVLFAAFLIGSLSLLLSDGFGRGASLNKSYRLAIFLMMIGVLLVPFAELTAAGVPGDAFVLAGYLGLEAVLACLFLVLSQLGGTDPAFAFATGFLALFAGEAGGVALSNALALAQGSSETPYAVVALSGALALLSYVFLFTECDFDALSQIVSASDTFEETCAHIVGTYALSARESEILAYALRGRTGERIAQELFISKSTVDTHLRRIYAKCGVHSRQELLDLAERM